MGKKRRRMTFKELMEVLNSAEVFPSLMGCLIIVLVFVMLLVMLVMGVQM